jgi:hypothetical protein
MSSDVGAPNGRNSIAPHGSKRTRAAVKSGLIRLDGAVVRFNSRKHGSFAIPLDHVAAIGEYTTDNGPLVDDWFLVFVLNDGADWLEASMYAEGIAAFLNELSAALSTPMDVGLAASADFKSRVIWPPTVGGRRLFEFSPITANRFLRRIKLAIIPEMAHQLSAEVRIAVKQCP